MADRSQSSATIIFSLVSSMLGSSVLAVPWSIARGGLIGGTVAIVGLCLISYYTGWLILRNAQGKADFSDRCREVLGTWSLYAGQLASFIVLFGVLIAYHIIMSTNLLAIVDGASVLFGAKEEAVLPQWVSPLIVLLVVFPLCLLRGLAVLVRLSSFGIISVLFLTAIIIYSGAATPVGGQIRLATVKWVTPNLPQALGVLALAFCIHNSLLSFFQNARRPGRNTRSLGLAFAINGMIYLGIGIVGYIGYHDYVAPDGTPGIRDNFLTMLDSTNVLATVARIALILQLAICFPLVMKIMRSVFLTMIFRTKCCKGNGSAAISAGPFELHPVEGNGPAMAIGISEMHADVDTADRTPPREPGSSPPPPSDSAEEVRSSTTLNVLEVTPSTGEITNRASNASVNEVSQLRPSCPRDYGSTQCGEPSLCASSPSCTVSEAKDEEQAPSITTRPLEPLFTCTPNETKEMSATPSLEVPSAPSEAKEVVPPASSTPPPPAASPAPSCTLSEMSELALLDKPDAPPIPRASSSQSAGTSPAHGEPDFAMATQILPATVGLLAVTTIFALFFPNIGQVLRFSGAFCGLIYVFGLPVLVEMALRRGRYRLLSSQSCVGAGERALFATHWALHGLILVFGLVLLVLQFV